MTTIVKVYKLLSGQEIIGCWVQNVSSPTSEHQRGVKLEKVRDIAPQSDQKGGWRLTLAPFVIVNPESPIDLWDNAIACEVLDVPEILQTEYLGAVSGIQIARVGVA